MQKEQLTLHRNSDSNKKRAKLATNNKILEASTKPWTSTPLPKIPYHTVPSYIFLSLISMRIYAYQLRLKWTINQEQKQEKSEVLTN